MEYKLENGSTLTDSEIEAITSEFESGEWEGHLINIHVEDDATNGDKAE